VPWRGAASSCIKGGGHKAAAAGEVQPMHAPLRNAAAGISQMATQQLVPVHLTPLQQAGPHIAVPRNGGARSSSTTAQPSGAGHRISTITITAAAATGRPPLPLGSIP
jgi:hypothetical protein